MQTGLEIAREAYSLLAEADSLAELRAAFDAQGAGFSCPPEVHCTPARIGGRPAEWLAEDVASDQVIYFLHGGGYILGSLLGYRHLAAEFARAAKARTLLLDYRLAPENPFPAALDDALAGYRELLAQGIDSRRIALVGDSAGGNLVVTVLLALRDAGLPLPGCAVCLSPWIDYDATGASMETKAQVEPTMTRKVLHFARDSYFEGADPNGIKAADILGADFSSLPPLLIQVGSHEVLLDDSLRLANLASRFDVPCTLEVWSKMIHVFQLYYPILEEGRDAIQRAATFINSHCASPTADAPSNLGSKG